MSKRVSNKRRSQYRKPPARTQVRLGYWKRLKLAVALAKQDTAAGVVHVD